MTGTTEKRFVKIDDLLKSQPFSERKMARDSERAARGLVLLSSSKERIHEEIKELMRKGERAMAATPENLERNQFTLIDCCFLAAIMAKVHNDPFALSETIQNNGDETFTVRLPGSPEVRVSAPTDEEVAEYVNSGRESLLLALIKKGYRQMLEQKTFHFMDVPVNARDISSLLSMSVTSVTGHHAHLDNLIRGDLDATRESLNAAITEKRIVVAGIRTALYYIEPARRPNGLPMGHAFTVLAYDKENDTITLLNPWGRDEACNENGEVRDGMADGVFQMKTFEFFASFSYVAYEER